MDRPYGTAAADAKLNLLACRNALLGVRMQAGQAGCMVRRNINAGGWRNRPFCLFQKGHQMGDFLRLQKSCQKPSGIREMFEYLAPLISFTWGWTVPLQEPDSRT